jgi:hypothetical protein
MLYIGFSLLVCALLLLLGINKSLMSLKQEIIEHDQKLKALMKIKKEIDDEEENAERKIKLL